MHLRTAFALFIITTAISAQPLRVVKPPVDSLSTGYYIIDSDDPISSEYWRPRYNFVDTLFDPTSWHRIYPGPQSIPSNDPNGISWRSINGDTTDNTFAGPIPIGFSFNFYDVNYDSVYLSSNGYLGFGNFDRAMGNDGPGYYSKTPACLPDTTLPKAIAAFMMTDASLNHDPQFSKESDQFSRVLYRSSPNHDSLYISVYKVFRVIGDSGLWVKAISADIQVVLTKTDSGSITFHYRKFYSLSRDSIDSTKTSLVYAQKLFRTGCYPVSCSQFASTIGIQNANGTLGATYMCHGAFTSLSTVADIHSGFAVRFRRFRNLGRVERIIAPVQGTEILCGDTITPVAEFRNTDTMPHSMTVMYRIRNVANRHVVYLSRKTILGLSPNETRVVSFTPFVTSSVPPDSIVGKSRFEALILPAGASDNWPYDSVYDLPPQPDKWSFDDTLSAFGYFIQRLEVFQDFNNNFSSPYFDPGTIPDRHKWISCAASVVDGDVFTLNPLPPRGRQGEPSEVQLNSPVIMLDGRDFDGLERNHCASGGSLSMFGNASPVSEGQGDTITSFPINVGSVSHGVLEFSYERGGKKTYFRNYDAKTLVGPERTVLSSDSSIVYQAGDSLVVDFADPSQTVNITAWKQMWAKDGGMDYNFVRAFIPIDSPFTTDHFRFRIRLKNKSDVGYRSSTAYRPTDDYDEWYLDNFLVATPFRPELQVSNVGVRADWPYYAVPARQAVEIPIAVTLSNNGGVMSAGAALDVVINSSGDTAPVYAKRITIPAMSPVREQTLTAPRWNASTVPRQGLYAMSAFLNGYDAESQNDSTFSSFVLDCDSSYRYENSDSNYFVGTLHGVHGQGLRLSANNSRQIAGTFAGHHNSGSVAVKFDVFQKDSLAGVLLFLGSADTVQSPIRITLHQSNGPTPGPMLSGCASFTTVRTPPFDQFTTYNFPCGPISLDTGEYWISVSQLDTNALELGGSAARSSVDWVVYDSTNPDNCKFVMNNPELMGRFAFEDSAGTGNWIPFYSADGKGVPVFGMPVNGVTARSINSEECGKYYNVFNGQGSWIPMIRPYMATGNITAVQPSNVLPSEYLLAQNFPDPFSSSTAITYSVPRNDAVRIVVSDLLGREVRTLVENRYPAGVYHETWDGCDSHGNKIADGEYIMMMSAGVKTISKMVHVLR